MSILMIGSRKPAVMRALSRAQDLQKVSWLEHPESISESLKGFYAETDRQMSQSQFQGIVATSESTLLLAALARARYDLPGPSMQDAVIATNKWVMRRSLQGRIKMPKFWLSSDPTRPSQTALFSKPLDDSAARGVREVGTRVPGEKSTPSNSVQIMEEKIEVQSEYHVDGVFESGHVVWSVPSVYDRPVYLARTGARSSVLLEEGPKAQALRDLTQTVVGGIQQASGVFHMEFFESPSGFVFGEFGLRPGGGGIAAMLEHLLGADLWGAHISAQRGQNVAGYGPKRNAPAHAGLIMARRATNMPAPIPPEIAGALPGVVGLDPGNSALDAFPTDSCSFAYSLICQGLMPEEWKRYTALLSGAETHA